MDSWLHDLPEHLNRPTKMATSIQEAQRSLLDNRIHILDTATTEASPAKLVFRRVGTILALIRVSVFVLRSSVGFGTSFMI